MTTNRCTNGDRLADGIPTRAPAHVTLTERVLLATAAALVLAGCVVVTWRHLSELGVGQ